MLTDAYVFEIVLGKVGLVKCDENSHVGKHTGVMTTLYIVLSGLFGQIPVMWKT